MRIVLLLIAILVLNVIFADRYLIPTKTIPADQIIYSDESPKTKNEFVLLNSQVYLDETNTNSLIEKINRFNENMGIVILTSNINLPKKFHKEISI